MTGQPPIPFGACAHWLSASRAFAPQQKKGDWVAGLGSRNAPSGDLSRWLLYAMRVEEILSLQEYDRRARTDWPHRIPNAGSADLAERLGDHIYDFSGGTPVQRPGVHGPANVDTDLDGKNVLVSRDFYNFGNRAIPLPDDLLPICHQTQGHKSAANARYLRPFVAWLRGLGLTPGQLYGWPDFIVDWAAVSSRGGCTIRQLDDQNDDESGEPG